ncbi:agamous-like MADS-box protein AGL66 [Heracleum sosnowskyi]|uniref:Agamous-like MADS-box protein AGL66 n=1 Tax=Heracleum sosnowskyi TaxID=360622 RepID=A0AAD8IUH2_9APIA|nr:agamous-like MADS-box protein AGL66 [Heracleum sosnowskyi]
MFSPSGRVSLYAGNNKGLEEIIERYVNLPEHERGRLIAKLKEQADENRQASPVSADSQLEDLQEELKSTKSQLEDVEKRLSIFESDPSKITTLDEVHYREHVLEETLKQIRMRKQILEGSYESYNISQPSTQVQMPGAEHMHFTGLVNRDANNVFQWFPQRDPQAQVMNFLDSNGLLPQREQTHQHRHQGVDRMMMPSLNLLSGGNMSMEEQLSRSHRRTGTDQEDTRNKTQNSNAGETSRVRAQGQASAGYAAVDVNLSPWANHQYYQTGNDPTLPPEQPRERALLELFLSQFPVPP